MIRKLWRQSHRASSLKTIAIEFSGLYVTLKLHRDTEDALK